MTPLRPLILSALVAVQVVLADPSSGCREKDDPLPEALREFTFQDRHVRVSFPPGYTATKPATLIFAYHDASMTPEEMEKLTQFNNPELNRNAIVVYPSALNGHWISDPASKFIPKEDSWDSDGEDPTNDMFYTKDLLNHMNEKFCINTRRVYATGMGPGGGMMHYLACNTHLSRRIAAFAAVGGAFYEGDGSEDRSWGKCMIGRRPVPVLEIHGENDNKYPLHQGKKKAHKKLLPASKWVRNWSKYNKCGDTRSQPTVSSKSNAVIITQLEGGQVSESLTYAGGATKTAYRCGWYQDRRDDDFTSEETSLKRISVLHYAVKGFKHGWPRLQFQPKDVEFHGNTITPTGSVNFDASAVILNYFRHHRLPDSGTIMAQAKDLLIERGAKIYKSEEGPRIRRGPHSEL